MYLVTLFYTSQLFNYCAYVTAVCRRQSFKVWTCTKWLSTLCARSLWLAALIIHFQNVSLFSFLRVHPLTIWLFTVRHTVVGLCSCCWPADSLEIFKSFTKRRCRASLHHFVFGKNRIKILSQKWQGVVLSLFQSMLEKAMTVGLLWNRLGHVPPTVFHISLYNRHAITQTASLIFW